MLLSFLLPANRRCPFGDHINWVIPPPAFLPPFEALKSWPCRCVSKSKLDSQNFLHTNIHFRTVTSYSIHPTEIRAKRNRRQETTLTKLTSSIFASWPSLQNTRGAVGIKNKYLSIVSGILSYSCMLVYRSCVSTFNAFEGLLTMWLPLVLKLNDMADM